MTQDTSVHRVNPRQARALIIDILDAGLVPYLSSSPGVGKSAIVHSIAKEAELTMIDHRLSTSEPMDMTGLARFNDDGTASFAPFKELFPLLGHSTPPKGSNGWLLFLDEFPSAPRSVQAAAYKLILDRKVGQHELHPDVAIVTAGNLTTDKAIVNNLSTAMQSRLVHLELLVDPGQWMSDVALARKFDSRIIGFLGQSPSALFNFDPNHTEKTFCCPRTWEFMNRLIQGKKVTDDKLPIYAGTIGANEAMMFTAYCKIAADLINIKEILAGPETCRMANEPSAMWATVTHMIEHVEMDNFDKLTTYANRMKIDMRILFYRAVMVQHQSTFRHHPAMIKAMMELSRYLT